MNVILLCSRCYRLSLSSSFPDTVCCQSHVSKLGNSSCELTTTITSKTHEKLRATAKVVIVNYDYKALASTRWSDSERTALKQFM